MFVSIDRWLGRRHLAIAVLLLTAFATILAELLAILLQWLLFASVHAGALVTTPLVAIIVSAPIIFYAQIVIRRLAQNKRDLINLTEQLRAARWQAEEAHRARAAFLHEMSHELRTPLNAIIGFSDIIQCEIFGPIGVDQYKQYINDINTSGLRLLTIVDEILNVTTTSRRSRPHGEGADRSERQNRIIG